MSVACFSYPSFRFLSDYHFNGLLTKTIINGERGWMKIKLLLTRLCFLNAVLSFVQLSFAQQKQPILLSQAPFMTITGGVVIVQAFLKEQTDTLNFVLDTGSGGISLDSATVAHMGLRPEPSEVSVKGLAGIRKVPFLYKRTLVLPGLEVDSLDFHVNDYSFLSAVYGIPVNGIIGYSFFSRFIVRLDYDQGLLSVFKPGSFVYPKGGTLIKPNLRRLPIHGVDLYEGKRTKPRILHDSGAGVCLMLSTEFARDSVVLSNNKKIFKKDGHGLGGRIKMDLTTVREVRIGPYRFRRVPVLLFDDVFEVTNYPYLGGLLGNDLLRRFNVVYNYPDREIHLKPNSHFKDRFDYAYTGLDLMFTDGKTYLGGVIEGSPADQAGLKEGDLIFALDGKLNPGFHEIKRRLQSPKARVRLIVRRGNQFFDTRIRIASIR